MLLKKTELSVEEDNLRNKRKAGLVVGVFLLLSLPFLVGWTYPENLWQGLIGEAVGEGYNGIYAVACVYKNRLQKGLPLGCVALKRRDLDAFIKTQGKKYEIMAKEIIYKVFTQTNDITKGATHYENIERFGIPRWVKNMVRTVKIGKHTFYKEK